jgi:hypothetical protein
MNFTPLFSRGQATPQQGQADGSAQIRSAPPDQPRPQGQQNAGTARVTAADVIVPPTPRAPALQTYEVLGIPDSYRAAVEKELTAGEKVLWVGRPSRNPKVHPQMPALTVIGYGLLGLGVLVAFVSAASGAHVFPFVFSGVLLLLGGVFLIPKFIDTTKACRSCYVVTNRRAMIVQNSLWAMGAKVQSYVPHQLLGLERRNHPEVPGAGDLIFEYKFIAQGNSFDHQTGFMLQQGAGANQTGAPNRVAFGFLLLDQVAEVEYLIRTSLLGDLENTIDGPEQALRATADAGANAEPISTACACGVTIEAPGGLAGKSVRCPQCSAAVTIPSVANADGSYLEHGQVPPELKKKVLAELDPNDKVVWVGQPVGALVFLRGIAYVVAGGIFFLIGAVWMINQFLPAKAANAAAQQKAVAGQKAPATAAAPKAETSRNLLGPAGMMFVSLGFVAVPFVRWHFARRTCYVLTNRRAFVYKEGIMGPTRESYPPLEVAAMRRSDSWLQKDSGDLIFRSVTVISTTRTRGRVSQTATTVNYGFLAIPHIQEVATLVRETLIDRFVEKLNRASAL